MKATLAIVKCHVLFISFFLFNEKKGGEYSEPVLAAIKFQFQDSTVKGKLKGSFGKSVV